MMILLPDDFRRECVAEQYNLDCLAADIIARAANLDRLAGDIEFANAKLDAREEELNQREADVLRASLEVKRRKADARRSSKRPPAPARLAPYAGSHGSTPDDTPLRWGRPCDPTR